MFWCLTAEGDERRAGWRKERQPCRRGEERERESGQLHTASQVYSDNRYGREEKRGEVKRRKEEMEIIKQEE